MPCLVRELNDEEATRIRVIENLQREDLTLSEESEAIRGLEAKGPASRTSLSGWQAAWAAQALG